MAGAGDWSGGSPALLLQHCQEGIHTQAQGVSSLEVKGRESRLDIAPLPTLTPQKAR